MSSAKGMAAQQQHQHQRNTMTKYFPILQDGTSSRGSEQHFPGQPGRDRAEAIAGPPTAEAACQTEPGPSAAEQARMQALEAELEHLRQEASQLRCPSTPCASCSGPLVISYCSGEPGDCTISDT